MTDTKKGQTSQIPSEVEAACALCLRKTGLGPQDWIIVSYSGGPDSSALAQALFKLRSEFGYRLSLVHVDHGMRPKTEREAEAAHVRDFAQKRALEICCLTLSPGSVAALAVEKGCGPEAAARELRYRLIADIVPPGQTAYLALGHTKDDQDETMVMRFFSGAGIRGLRGIPRTGLLKNDQGQTVLRILRPLLDIKKRFLISYLQEEGIAFSTDSSNKSPIYTRNRLRLDIMARLSEEFPGMGKALSRTRERFELLEELLDELSQGLFSEEEGHMRADIESLRATRPALILHALEGAVGKLLPGSRIPYALLRRMTTILADCLGEGRCRSSSILVSGCGIRLRALEKSVILERHLALGRKKGYFFNILGPGLYGNPLGLGFEIRLGKNADQGPSLASFSYPLALRSPRPLDKLESRGGAKYLSDIFREWSVPEDMREEIALLEDGRGIVCVLGALNGYVNRYAERGIVPDRTGEYLCVKVQQKGGFDGSER